MKNYKVIYSRFAKQWMVINVNTRLAQSAYKDKIIAEQVMRSLNARTS